MDKRVVPMDKRVVVTMDNNPSTYSLYGPYGAQGPFRESLAELKQLMKRKEFEEYVPICNDIDIGKYRWIIDAASENSYYKALGPFEFKLHYVRKNGMWVIGIDIDKHRMLSTNGRGVACIDCDCDEFFWIICMPLDIVCMPIPIDSCNAMKVQTFTYKDAGVDVVKELGIDVTKELKGTCDSPIVL